MKMTPKFLRLLWMVNGIFVLAGGLLGPLYAVYVADIGVGNDIGLISLSFPVFLMSTTFFVYVVGKWGERRWEQNHNSGRDKHSLLLLSYFLRAAAWFAYIFVASPLELIALQIILGLGEALGGPTFDALFAEHTSRENSLQHYSSWKIIANALTALASAIGGGIVTLFGFSALFSVMAGLAAVAGCIFWLAMRTQQPVAAAQASPMPAVEPNT